MRQEVRFDGCKTGPAICELGDIFQTQMFGEATVDRLRYPVGGSWAKDIHAPRYQPVVGVKPEGEQVSACIRDALISRQQAVTHRSRQRFGGDLEDLEREISPRKLRVQRSAIGVGGDDDLAGAQFTV